MAKTKKASKKKATKKVLKKTTAKKTTKKVTKKSTPKKAKAKKVMKKVAKKATKKVAKKVTKKVSKTTSAKTPAPVSPKLEQLLMEKAQVQDRLARIQKDLKSPMDANLEEQALQSENREVLQGLEQVEMRKLASIEVELSKLSQK